VTWFSTIFKWPDTGGVLYLGSEYPGTRPCPARYTFIKVQMASPLRTLDSPAAAQQQSGERLKQRIVEKKKGRG